MKLLLFDLDGTLLRATGGHGRRAVEQALGHLVGRAISAEGIDFSGKTDPHCLREVLEANAVTPDDDLLARALELYRHTAEPLLAGTVEAYPGVHVLIERLRQETTRAVLALLTGNVEPMAYAKLAAIGLAEPFAFGAFGSDHPDRNCLPAIALERATAHHPYAFDGSSTVVIGDTPRDIACAQVIGARTVCVATGRFDRATLEAAGADLVFDDFRDTEAVLAALLG